MSLPESVTGGEVMTATPVLCYVNAAENSDKWWRAQIEYHAKDHWTLVVRFGRTGTPGQKLSTAYTSLTMATHYMNARTAKKRKKGYTTVSDSPLVGGKKNSKGFAKKKNVKKKANPILIGKPISLGSDDDYDYWGSTCRKNKQKPPKKPKPKPEPKGRRIILD